MSAVETKRATWPTMPVDRLAAHPGNLLPQPDEELTADIATNGVQDPLYVVTTSTGAPQVLDGLRRLAAAQAAGLAEVPTTHRPVIRLTELTPHPDNPREELDIDAPFVATFVDEGCRIPVKFRVLEDGTRQIVDGHRRYYGAEAAGLTHVPYEEDERDDAGTFLDMVITAKHRNGLTERETANALFGAAEAGAGVKRLATAAGTTQKAVKGAMRALRSEAARKAETAAGTLNLATMLAMADLESRDAEAAEKVTAAIAADPTEKPEWLIRRAGVELDQRDQLAAQQAELKAKGVRMLAEAELGPKASRLYYIVGDTSAHATECQGAVWVLSPGASSYAEYCANAEFFGHQLRDPNTGGAVKPKETAAGRRRRKAGNLDWDTAEQARREWLAGFITPRSLPRTTADMMAQVVAQALTTTPNISSRIAGDLRTTACLPTVVGMPQGTSAADLHKRWSQPKDAPRVLLAMVAAAYEGYVNRTVWRTGADAQDADRRRAAAQWLALLTGLGYEPSPIEAAVRDGEDYQPAEDGEPLE